MHNTKLFFVGGACLALAGARPVHAEPFDESRGYMFYAISQPIKKEIVPPTTALPVDDAIIALAKASDFNFLADASHIPATQSVAPFPSTPDARKHKWPPKFFNVIGDFEEEAQLARLRYDDATLLLWKRPDIQETARELLAANKLSLTEPLPDQKTVFEAVKELRQNAPGWETDEWKNEFNRIRMGDVPLPQRQPLLALMRYGILRPEWKRELWLTDDFWKTVRVKAVPPDMDSEKIDPPTGQPVLLVYLGGQDEQGHFLPFYRMAHSLVALDFNHRLEFKIPMDEPALRTVPLVPEEPAPNPDELTPAQLEVATELGAPISLEAKRRPLKELISDAAKQSGVALSVSQEVAPLPVTARVQKMPLFELMGALARLTGARWQKNAKGYALQARPLPRWQQLILQSGEGDFEGHGVEAQHTEEEGQQFRAFEQSVGEEVMNQPQTTEGVPFSALSGEHQAHLKEMALDAAATTLVQTYSSAFVLASPGGVLHLNGHQGLERWSVALLMGDARIALAYTNVSEPATPKTGATLDAATPNPETNPNVNQ